MTLQQAVVRTCRFTSRKYSSCSQRLAYTRASSSAGAVRTSSKLVHKRSSCGRAPGRPTRTRISRTSSHWRMRSGRPRAEAPRGPGECHREPSDQARFGRSGGAQQEVTPDPFAGGERVHDKGRHPIQAIAQQQRALGQLRQQPQRQGPFRFALPADRRGQRIVQPHFQQDRRGELGEGRAAAARPGFLEGGRDLGRIDQTELRAIERHQPPAAPERLGLPPRRSRPQHPSHQVGEDLPRQPRAAIRPRTVGQRVVETTGMVGQRPGVLHHMERQGRQQLRHRHARFASAAAAPAACRVGRPAAPTPRGIPSAAPAPGVWGCVDIPSVSTDFLRNVQEESHLNEFPKGIRLKPDTTDHRFRRRSRTSAAARRGRRSAR